MKEIKQRKNRNVFKPWLWPNAMLYIIAGVSLSGKTSARRLATRQFGISGLDTDTLRSMMWLQFPELKVGHDQDVYTNYEHMRPVVASFIFARSFFKEPYILEGDCIYLDEVKKSLAEGSVAQAIVVGYPNKSLDDFILQLESAPQDHWSRSLSHEALIQKLESFLNYSRFLETEARRLELPFLDISDYVDPDQSTREILTRLAISREESAL